MEITTFATAGDFLYYLSQNEAAQERALEATLSHFKYHVVNAVVAANKDKKEAEKKEVPLSLPKWLLTPKSARSEGGVTQADEKEAAEWLKAVNGKLAKLEDAEEKFKFAMQFAEALCETSVAGITAPECEMYDEDGEMNEYPLTLAWLQNFAMRERRALEAKAKAAKAARAALLS